MIGTAVSSGHSPTTYDVAHSVGASCTHSIMMDDSKSEVEIKKKRPRVSRWRRMTVVLRKTWRKFDFGRSWNLWLTWIVAAAFLLYLFQSQFDIRSNVISVGSRRLSASKLVKYVRLPKSEWPFTLKEHPEQFETIIHPGDNKTEMMVAKFWSPPIHRKMLMPRELAMKVGTCIEPDSKGSYVRGADCPLDKRTIFVTIASYRDFQCRETVESLMTRAAHPERIRIGVVDQIVDGLDVACDAPIESCDSKPEQALCLYKDQVDVFELEAQLSLGPTFARNLGYRMYRGEYYAMQTDAHITFVQDWDTDIISQLEATKNEMAVLTTYLSDVHGSVDKDGHSLRDSRPIMCNSDFEMTSNVKYIRHQTQPESEPKIKGCPQLEPWWAAGFSFSRGHFFINVPYDQYQVMVFQGEEVSVSIKGFTIGYDFYTPERSVCFHHYDREDKRIKYYGENDKKYDDEVFERGMRRVVGVIHMGPDLSPESWDHEDEDFYGLGGVRTPEKFYKTFGIDVLNQRVQRHMCDWVDGAGPNSMHNQLTVFLRPDGMGIDYSKVNFVYQDLRPDEKDYYEDDQGEEEEEEVETSEGDTAV